MKYTDARYPEKINDLIDNEGNLSEEGKKVIEQVSGNPVAVQDGKLIVDKIEVPVGPIPVAEFDGVKYYHKHEFDLEELVKDFSGQHIDFDPITGEEKENYPPLIKVSLTGPGPDYISVSLILSADRDLSYTLYGHEYSPVNYTSRAFTVVHDQAEVTDNTKIYLPNNVTAYYGFLSEDGKTFISYWNEEGEGPVEAKPVNKITDGKTEVEIHDARLSSEDTGNKFLRDDFTWQAVGGDSALLTPITYADLKALRDAEGLKPGMFYRITDYNFTTTVANTHSAGHQFDIIVLALDESHLAERAWAAHHEGDTYFASNNLSAWKLWYDLDNDDTKYEWADTVNGKGVIYRMIDEFENDVPYDFKNLIYEHHQGFEYFQWGTTYVFVRDSSLDADGYYGWRCDRTPSAWSNPYCFTNTLSLSKTMTLYSDTSGSTISFGGNITSVAENDWEQYTFTETHDNSIYDASVRGLATNGLNCIQNIIKPSFDSSNNLCRKLNNITFYTSLESLSCSNNTFDNGCFNNNFDNGCSDNTFGNSCFNNNFADNCYNNTFADNCYNNTFGANCHTNTFGTDCSYNTFDSSCYCNAFSSNCSYNIFNTDCYHNTFGIGCANNTFGTDCSYNTFDSSCHHNTFGISCVNNTSGIGCFENTFGNYCSNNTLGNVCYCIKFYNNIDDIDYVRNVIVDSGCSYINLFSTDTSATDFNYLQNIHIHLGVQGTSDNPLSIEVPDRNLAYSTDYYANGSQSIVLGGNN